MFDIANRFNLILFPLSLGTPEGVAICPLFTSFIPPFQESTDRPTLYGKVYATWLFV
jgi:hypothetical protein